MKRQQFHKITKSSEEIQLEQALFAQAEWKVKFSQGKIKNENTNPNKKEKKEKPKEKQEKKEKAKRKSTIPVNVKVLERKSISKKIESSEEREAREIQEAKDNLSAQLNQNKKYRKNSAPDMKYRAVHSTRPVTTPITPRMMMGKSSAPKQQKESSSVSAAECKNFYTNLRGKISNELTKAMEEGKNRPRITVPKPPSFATDERMASHKALPTKEEQDLAIIKENQFKARPFNKSVFDGCGANGVPCVKAAAPTVIEAFAIKGESNPTRRASISSTFKARPMPTYQPSEIASRRASSSKPLTVPKSPPLSKSQPRQSSFEEEPVPQFEARPIPDYAELSSVGINTKVKRRVSTIPTSPDISKPQPRESMSTEEPVPQFEARPIPDYAELSSVGINTKVKHRVATIPISPDISKPQPREQPESEEDEYIPQFEARPIPDYAELSSVGINTKVKPRDVTIPTSPDISKPQPRESMSTEEPVQFKARPMPDLNHSISNSTHISVKPVTIPEPFNLKGDEISHQKLANKERQLEQESISEIEKRNFVAKPVPDWNAKRFTPRHSSKPLTEFEEFEISSSHRTRRQEDIDEENELLEKANQFIARKLPESTFKPSFVPTPSSRPPLTVMDNILEAGNNRTKERKEYDKIQKQRVMDEEAMRIKMVQEREEQAEADYKRRMQIPIEEGGLKFVARRVSKKVLDTPDLVVEPSHTELTAPVTPVVLKRATRSSTVGGAVRVPVNH
jgi:hypothetical protein